MRVHHEIKSDSVKVDHEKKNDGVRVDHEKRSDGLDLKMKKCDGVRVHRKMEQWGASSP